MPELMEGAILFGLVTAGFSWIVINGFGETRSLPFWGVIVIGVVAAYVGAPLFALAQNAGRTIAGFPEFTGGGIFLGLWVALVALTFCERKGQPRRIPIWGVVLIVVGTALVLPPLIDRLTGAYQNASLRADANACTRWTAGVENRRQATNICDYPISVGLCLPGEGNPMPCKQSTLLAPGEQADFDTGGAPLSALPSNANGYTIVACRPPHRPSRTLSVIGRGYDGVCLPEG